MKSQLNTVNVHNHTHRNYGNKVPNIESKFNFNKVAVTTEVNSGENTAYIYSFADFPDLVKIIFTTNLNSYLKNASSYMPSIEGEVKYDMGPFDSKNKKLGVLLNNGLSHVGIMAINHKAGGTWYEKKHLEILKEALDAFYVEEGTE